VNRDALEPLLKAVEAGERFKRIAWLPGNQGVRDRVMEVLPQAVYWVREQNRLEKHNDIVQSLSFSPDGQILATGGYDNTVILWSANGKKLPALIEHSSEVMSINFSPDGQILASADQEGTVKLWDYKGNLQNAIVAHDSIIHSIQFNPKNNGQTFATASQDGTIRLWNRQGNPLRSTIQSAQQSVFSLSFSPDGKTLASAGADGTVKLWNLAKNSSPIVLNHKDRVRSVSFSKDGIIATASKDKTVKLWQSDGSPIITLQGKSQSEFVSVSFSQDGQTLAAGTIDGKIELWTRTGNLIRKTATLKQHSGRVNSLSFSPDGKIASASNDQLIKIWQPDSPLITRFDTGGDLMYVSFSPDGKMLASAGKNKTVNLWEQNDRLWMLKQSLNDEQDQVDSVIFNPDGSLIATTNRDNKVILRNSSDGTIRQTIQKGASVRGRGSISFHPKDRILATADTEGIVKFWNFSGQLLDQFHAHDTEIFSISFHPNGNQILTTSDDHTTKLWDIKGRLSHTFIGHNAGVWDASFSQDGKQLATAGKDNKVFLWNIQGKHLHTLEGHTAPVMRVRFSPNDRLIATASDDDTIKLWYSDGTAIATLKGHEDDVNSIHFNPSYPNILASVSLDNTLILWNIENLSLDGLLQQGCYWVRDYLKNNYRAPQNLCR